MAARFLCLVASISTFGISFTQAATRPARAGTPDASTNIVAVADSYSTAEDTLLFVDTGAGVLANDVDGAAETLFAALVTDASNGYLTLGTDGSFYYLPYFDFDGTDTFQYQATNSTGTSTVTTVTITVTPVNDPPVLLGSDIEVVAGREQTQVGVFALDSDAGTNVLSLAFSSALATFRADSTPQVTAVTNALDPGQLTLVGTISDIITFINSGMVHVGVSANDTTNFPYVVTLDDHGYTGTDPGLTGTATNETSTVTNLVRVVPGIRAISSPSNGLYNIGDNLDFVVQTTEAVTVNTTGGTPRFPLSLWTGTRQANYLSSADGTNLTFRYTVQSGDRVIQPLIGYAIDLNGGEITDTDAENLNTVIQGAGSTSGISVDGQAPHSTGFNPPANGWYGLESPVILSVPMGEPILVNTNSGTPRLGVTLDNTNRFAEYVPGGGGSVLRFVYMVEPGDSATNGIIVDQTVDLNGGSITDLAGNTGVVDFGSNMPLPAVLVDGVAPELFDALAYFTSNQVFTAGDTLQINLYTTEDVTVNTLSATPELELQLDSSFAYAEYISNAAPNILCFILPILPGDVATNGVLVSDHLFLNDSTIRDHAGNDVVTLTPEPHLLNGFSIDALAPTATNVVVPTNGVYVMGSTLDFTFEFSEPITVTGPLNITIAIGAAERQLDYLGGDGTNTLYFSYTVQDGDFSTNGISIVAVAEPWWESIVDAAGNNFDPGVLVDLTVPGAIVDAQAPVAVADAFTLGEDGGLSASVITNDYDPDTNVLSAALVADVASGQLNLASDGSFTYHPATNFYGVDSFTYTVTDGVLTSATATVTLTVLATNDPPQLLSTTILTTTGGVAIAVLDITASDPDAGTNPVHLTLIASDAGASLTAADGGGVTTSNNTFLELHLWGSISNLNTFLAASNVAFTASTNFTQFAPLQVRLNDDGNTGFDPGIDSNPASEEVSIEIFVSNGAVNEAPMVSHPVTNLAGTYGTAFSLVFPTNTFFEPDADPLNYTATGLPPGLTLVSATRTISGLPAAAGTFNVELIAGDQETPELFATNTFIITIDKAILTATADDASRACGAANPALTITYSGLVGSDTVNAIDNPPTASTTATPVSPPGSYPITLTGGSDDNYTFAPVPGTLTITNGAGLSIKGVFQGLFYETNEVTVGRSGAIQVKTTDSGKYSGLIELAGKKFRLSGTFDSGRKATNTFVRPGLSPLVAILFLDACNPPQALLGAITDGSWTAEVYGAPVTFHARTNPAPMAGRYTMVLPGIDGNPSVPHGDGYGVVTVTTSGKLKLIGALADGTKFTDGSVVNDAGLWPLYVPLYKNSGSTLAWQSFNGASNEIPSGLVSWIRPSTVGGTYFGPGFTNEITSAGSSYLAPAKGATILSWSNGVAMATGGNLIDGTVTDISVSLANRVTLLGTNISKLTLSAKDGRFKGSLKHPVTGKTVPFNGVLLQGLDQGYGFFLGTDESGRIGLEPSP